MKNHFDIFMKRAIELARKGTGFVSPNPRVGAVVVNSGQIISEGFHAKFGGPHAEVVALSDIDHHISEGSTLYVNLEPCSHKGKTPPCTDMIIRSGVKHVVIGTVDPNPMVAGQGIQRLKEAGIETSVGVLEPECIKVNESFFKFIQEKKPFYTLKIAQTLDGKIATAQGHSKWITGDSSRRWVHQLRLENDAVLVGVNTVIADDPELTVRWVKGPNPKRIILDRTIKTPLESKLFKQNDTENTIVATTQSADSEKRKQLENLGVTIWQVDEVLGQISLCSLEERMAEENITSVLVEGGMKVFTSFIQKKMLDRLFVFIAPKLFGEGKSPIGDLSIHDASQALTFRETKWHHCDCDIVFEGRM